MGHRGFVFAGAGGPGWTAPRPRVSPGGCRDHLPGPPRAPPGPARRRAGHPAQGGAPARGPLLPEPLPRGDELARASRPSTGRSTPTPGATRRAGLPPRRRGGLPREPHARSSPSSRRPPSASFPVLAFSVAYELELTGLLDDAGAVRACRSSRRSADERHPLVVAGRAAHLLQPGAAGALRGRARPGRGGRADPRACWTRWRAPRTARRCWTRLARTPGLPGARAGRAVATSSPRRTDDRLPARSQIVTPNTELRSMFLIEPERGCSRGCHYCVMRRTTNGGMRTVPAGAGALAHARRTPGGWGWWARR